MLWWLFICEVYKDGDCINVLFNKWNPLTYIVVFILLTILLFVNGISEIISEWKKNKFLFSTEKYFKDNPKEFHIIKRFRK